MKIRIPGEPVYWLLGLTILAMPGILGAAYLLSKNSNETQNTADQRTSGYHLISYPRGPFGHVDYMVYPDCSQEMHVYSPIGHRFGDAEFYHDTDGNGNVDRIQVHGADSDSYKLKELLTRDNDYLGQRKKFDAADALLRDTMKKYPHARKSMNCI
ncbi:MAG: hypothetical protein HY364_01490 [Candidatus Aenigmarchaeota archaeon]|nr:hypothetical protein [Candidatus Aenigmarchaeota archaeon]